MSAVYNETGVDAGVPQHYGDPLREQRWLEAGQASVDLSSHPVFTVSGGDRLDLRIFLAQADELVGRKVAAGHN